MTAAESARSELTDARSVELYALICAYYNDAQGDADPPQHLTVFGLLCDLDESLPTGALVGLPSPSEVGVR